MQTHRDRVLRVGTRTSRLARWQTDYVVRLLEAAWPGLACTVEPFVTQGDRTLNQPLPEIGGKGLFTYELERALRDGEIDLAVHSLKDLPVDDAPGLIVGAIPRRADAHDVLVAQHRHTLETLPPGSVVGTSSPRRQAQLLALRPDLQVRSIRGNVATRVRKALSPDEGYDATVLAAAGLTRLDMDDVISDWLPLDVMLPAPGQAALAVQCRAGDEETLALLAAIDDELTRRATTAERLFLQALGGGCSAPIAAYASPLDENGTLLLRGLIASPDGQDVIRVSARNHNPELLASELAGAARELGAGRILEQFGQQAAGDARPLEGRRIVVTRPRPQAPELVRRLEALGAEAISFPTIRIEPMENTEELDAAIARLAHGEYHHVIFTSVNGVAIFWERLEALGYDVFALNDVHVAAIGPATGEALRERGIDPDFIPEEFVAEAIAVGLGHVWGQRILLPRASIARPTLRDQLAARGAQVDEVPTYRTLPAQPDGTTLLALELADIFTFTSSSTVRNFVKLVGGPERAKKLTQEALVACIGPITAQTARELGLDPVVVAERYTMEGLAAALAAYAEQV
jgi:hydroxymethylbilane synthase